MMERASLLNGSVDIQSQHERGTTISVRIPVKRTPHPVESAPPTHSESQVAG
jgi:hypothetical protein